MIPEEDILHLIPQRPPFVMIDRLIDCDGVNTRTAFRVDGKNIFVSRGHLHESGLIENIAQTAAAGEGYMARKDRRPVRIGFIGAIKNLQVDLLPSVSDDLVTETATSGQVAGINLISGKIWCHGRIIVQCTMTIVLIG
ncbi:MAG: 3-hydroxyacyl-ACP dehydratase [Bacteroidota bacterium]|nr:3-hydroxyacyl-ACP dehydratase [Bacteroidota bacterium]MDP4245137.1 3-hydroxyacyl-ACP dehydratase [Bacteroidota bacterium]MDP4253354.1 3-hydroxyacyl-ACP dehydratase [Bacteroidota bacterium]MDP4260036.1 3-hydroxyacyl-ACP dehydratase [Bacteroidota bacterium]